MKVTARSNEFCWESVWRKSVEGRTPMGVSPQSGFETKAAGSIENLRSADM